MLKEKLMQDICQITQISVWPLPIKRKALTTPPKKDTQIKENSISDRSPQNVTFSYKHLKELANKYFISLTSMLVSCVGGKKAGF